MSAAEIVAIEEYLSTKYIINLGPDLARQALQQNYVNQRLGALIHWSTATFWTDDDPTPDGDPDPFAPTDLDIDQWLDACISAGMEYAYLTTKHGDGFALWPTAYAAPGHVPYGITATTWWANNGHPDVISLFTSKCRTHGITPGIYFPLIDRTYEARTGTTIIADRANYWAMIQLQLTELLTNYGDIASVWVDAWGQPGFFDNIRPALMYDFIKSVSPNTIFLASDFPWADVKTSESAIPPGNTKLSEEISKIYEVGSWFWHAGGGTTLYTAGYFNTNIARANANNSTYVIGLTPDDTGHLPADHVALLATVHL